MASKSQICNMVLSRLSANSIVALTDDTDEGRLCNRMFEDIVEEIISWGDWTTCIRRASLAQTTNTPVGSAVDFLYEYQLPVDPLCLKVLNVIEATPGSVVYAKEDDLLLSN